MEHKVLNVLGFKLYVPTVLSFEKQYLETLNQLSGLVTPQLETLSDVIYSPTRVLIYTSFMQS